MDINDYRNNILELIRLDGELKKEFLKTVFVENFSDILEDIQELFNIHQCQYEGVLSRGRKVIVDAYSFDEIDNTYSLIVGDFTNENEMRVITQAEIKTLFNQLKLFTTEAVSGKLTDGTIDESHPVLSLAKDLKESSQKITKFRLYLITDRLYKTNTKKWAKEKINDIDCEFHVWDIERLFQSSLSKSGKEELLVNFEEYGIEGISSLQATNSKGEYEAYLCIIPGEALALAYNDFGSKLLEGNVRSFLSNKGKVNKGIQATIAEKPEMFFSYNNGISATAEGITTELTNGRLIIKTITNFQIVNGGQTTASLGLAKYKGIDLKNVTVQMKLSVLPPEKAKILIPQIAKYANMQNKVSDADFFSNHAYHIFMEDLSRKILVPPPPESGLQYGTHWFYERTRGQYINEQNKLTPAMKDKFKLTNPKNQVVTKTDIAKYVNSFRGVPWLVSSGAQKSFLSFAVYIDDEWSSGDSFFNEIYFKNVIAISILFKKTESIVTNQLWYQNGYRANIVAYTISKLQNIVATQGKGREIDLVKIWENQNISTEMTNQIEIIAEKVYTVLTDPNRSNGNVTQWAKMEKCWEKVLSLNIPLEIGLLKELVSSGNPRPKDRKF